MLVPVGRPNSRAESSDESDHENLLERYVMDEEDSLDPTGNRRQEEPIPTTQEVQTGFLACACFTLLEAWAQLEVDLQRWEN